MKKSGIYKWTSPSGKHYIGQAQNLHSRYTSFLNFNRTYTSSTNGSHRFETIIGEPSPIDKARKKYNVLSLWKYEILEYCDIEELNDKEKFYISLFDTTNSRKGYNCTEGGDGTKGFKLTTEQIKRRLANRRRYFGKENPNYGKHLSDDAKRRISEKNKGRKQSREQILKKSKQVVQYTLEGEFIREFDTMTEAAESVKCNKSLIMRVCQGKKKTAKGFIWKYNIL